MSDKRLIYADEVIRGMEQIMNSPWFKDDKYTLPVKKDAFHIVKNFCVDSAPTIDAVEVVRCKDCKYAIVNHNHIDKPLICCLTKMVGTTKEDWFCADGKRRMDGGAENE